jgi:hypothetical protein
LSNPGHHNTAVGNQWLIAHKDTFFAKAALLINSEHTGQIGADFYGYRLLPTITPWNFDWYAGGGPKLAPIVTKELGPVRSLVLSGCDTERKRRSRRARSSGAIHRSDSGHAFLP